MLSDKYWKKYEDDAVAKENARLRKQAQCRHEKWIKRCSVCNCILESDATATTATTHEHVL